MIRPVSIRSLIPVPPFGARRRHFVPRDYTARERPEYFVAEREGIVYQPDVYAEAARLAREHGLGRVIDVGCGDGRKLAALHPEFELVGIDYGENLEACRARYDFGTWVSHDLETSDELPVPAAQLRGSVVVAADVIEHLVQPQRLLAQLRAAQRVAGVVVLSTPERELVRGRGHLGPPGNPAHVREWTLPEFARLLRDAGFRGTLGLTRSTDREPPELSTMLAICTADGPKLVPDPDALRLKEQTLKAAEDERHRAKLAKSAAKRAAKTARTPGRE